jgi:tetratricopeptide (TPR) repeat protein
MLAFPQGNAVVVMDEDAFDYRYGDADGPDPAQQDLDALWPKVTRICVLEGAMFKGRAMGGPVLIDSSDANATGELASCLRIVEDPSTFGHCQCLGGPTIEFYSGPEHIATIGLQHGKAIRWKQWYHDAQLEAGDRLTRWLHRHGIAPAKLQAIYERGNNHLLGGSAPPSNGQRDARQLCLQAQKQAQEGNLTEALELCTRALGRDPDELDAYALRGQIHHHLGRFAEAATDCSAAIDRGLRLAEIYFIRAIAWDSAGRVEEALADFSMALHLDPEHAGARNSRGLIRTQLGRFDEALSDFADAIRLAPDWFLPYLHRGQLYHSRGQLDLALADFDRTVELAEKAAFGLGPEGDTMLTLVHCRRGDARYDSFREEEAEADFARARQFHTAAATSYLGDMWLRRCRYDQAREAFSQLIELRPKDVDGYLGRGQAHLALGDLGQAEADFSTAIPLQPDGDRRAHAMRAQVRDQQGRFDDALTDFNECILVRPDDPMAYLYRSHLQKKKRAFAAELEDLTKAHGMAPDRFEVCNSLAWFLATCSDAQLRDGSRAVALARHACQATDWNNSNCLDTLAAACAETGAFDEAIRRQTQAVQISPEELKSARQARLQLYQAGQAYRE